MQSIKYRPDIDGLRAIAILMVIIYHGFPNWLPTGFFGVDVFFVISGYLISSIIYKELRESRFHFLAFYGRRVKRIFPALIVVLFAVSLFGSLALFTDEFANLSKNIYAAVGFYSNFSLLQQVSYFDVESQHKPLLHLWSLAIEEQFYLVFPVFTFFFFKSPKYFLGLLVLLILLSLGYNVYHMNDENSFLIFYSPLARAWELLIGCALACLNEFPPFAPRLKKYAAFLGLALIGFTLMAEIPHWFMALPATFGAALIIWGDPLSFPGKKILGSSAMVGLGLISYPLYLWHWPLISFHKILNGIFFDDPHANTILVFVSVLLAVITYFFIEKPIRKKTEIQSWSILSGLMLVGAFHFQISNFPVLKNLMIQRSQVKLFHGGASIEEARNLSPDPDCLATYGRTLNHCRLNQPEREPTVLIAGDSESNRFFPGFAKVYFQRGENLLNLGMDSCPAYLGLRCMTKGTPEQNFERGLRLALAKPTLHTVILVNLGKRCIDGPCDEYAAGLEKTLTLLSDLKKRIVFIKNLPEFNFEPYTCIPNTSFQFFSRPLKQPCAMDTQPYRTGFATYRKSIDDVLRKFPNVSIWDPEPLFCDEKLCWAEKEGRVLFWDKFHPNIEGSDWLAARFPFFEKK